MYCGKPPKDLHVSVSAADVAAFVEHDRSKLVCFRCGETGHVRHQCLSYKVRMCRHNEITTCTDPNCAYAHSVDELRSPWRVRCVRVIKQNGILVCIGCNSTEHTFRKCPLTRDLIDI